MTELKFEIVELEEVTREVGRFGGIFRTVVIARRIGPAGIQVLAESDEIEWRRSDGIDARQDSENGIRAAHQRIIQSLLARGWEPMGVDAAGRVVTLKRRLPAADAEAPVGTSRWRRISGKLLRLPGTSRLLRSR